MQLSLGSVRARTIVSFFGLACLAMPSLSSAQVAPSLGQAGSFSVLAGSTVTNTGPTAVLGDLGVAPGNAVVGFPPGVVTGGSIHAGDAVALAAQSDLTAAYNQLAGQASNTTLTGQDLGGLTLTSGVYTFSSSAQLTGTLTLDAQGDPAAVFIFQIGTTLTTASGSRVVVINGGSDCNVFWQVGSSATLGTTTNLAGNILALASITLTTGVQLSGRALARNGAVTLDSNAVTICGLCSPITLAPATLPTLTTGVAFTQTIVATGGTAPYAFSISSGALPAGITLSTGGVLSGTSTTPGTFTFTVRATDAAGCQGETTYTLVVIAAVSCNAMSVVPTMLPQAVVGVGYQQVLTASGGTGPYTMSLAAGALPSGLAMTTTGSDTALISGTPAQAQAYTFTILAIDSADCALSLTYSGTVTVASAAIPAPALSPWSLLALLALVFGASSLSLRRS